MELDRLADLRARGVDAAMHLVAELGEDGLTMRGLARRLGVSTTAMYQLFENKAAIVRAVRFHGVETLDAALAPAFALEQPLHRIREMSRRYVEFARARPWLYRMLFASEPLAPDTLTTDELERLRTSLHALQSTLQEGMDRGQLRAGLDLEVVPLRLWARNHGLVLLLLAGKLGPQHPSLAVDDVGAFIDRFIEHTSSALAAGGEG